MFPLGTQPSLPFRRTVLLTCFAELFVWSSRITCTSVLLTCQHRQIVTNVFVQIIILLYLIDNNEQTSWMILMGSGIGVVIEAWKVGGRLRMIHGLVSVDTANRSPKR